MVNSILVYVFDGRIFCSLLCRNNVDDNSVENNDMDYNRSTAFPLPPRMRRFSMQVTECLIVAFSAVSVVIASILLLRLHPIIGLVLGTLVILFYTQGQSELNVANRLANGMTGIFKNIGLPIVFASIVGGCLLESGAAHRIVTDVVRLFGSQRVAPALPERSPRHRLRLSLRDHVVSGRSARSQCRRRVPLERDHREFRSPPGGPWRKQCRTAPTESP